MKKRFTALVLCVSLLCLLPQIITVVHCPASEREMVSIPTAQSSRSLSAVYQSQTEPRPVFTRTVDRTQIMKDEYDRPVWKLTVRGTFAYDGETVTAIESQCFQEVYDPAWRCEMSSCTVSGATVEGRASFEKQWLFVPTLIKQPSIKISCDAKGNIS